MKRVLCLWLPSWPVQWRTVAGLSPETLREYFHQNVRPNSLLVAAAGNVEHGPFVDRVWQALRDLKAKGVSQAEIDTAAVQMESFKKLYANPLVNVAFTFIEPFPVGILMTLVSALILRRR